jgi:hypothetical protein
LLAIVKKINSITKCFGGGRIPLAPGFRRTCMHEAAKTRAGAPAIRGHTPSWVRPGTSCCKIQPSAGRTRER